MGSTLAAFNMRNRQIRNKMFLTRLDSTSEKLARRPTLISMHESGVEVRTIADYGVGPISNDFVMVGSAPNVMIDDLETLDRNEVIFSHTGLCAEKSGFVDYDTFYLFGISNYFISFVVLYYS